MADVRETLQLVFRSVFSEPSLILEASMDAKTVDGWDSLGHLNLIIAMEKAFKVRFTTSEIAKLKQPGENVASLIRLLEGKLTKTI